MKNLPAEENECQLEYVCIGCNRTNQALAWSKCGFIAFGACNSVALYKHQVSNSAGKIVCLLNGHKSRVNCVHWLKDEDIYELQLISGSSDKDIIVWEGKDDKWVMKQVLQGHTKAVCTLAGIMCNYGGEKCSYIASAGGDFTLKLWNQCDGEDYECLQTISYGNGFVHTTAMANLPHNKGFILACGSDDCSVRLYTLEDNQLQLALVLKGHKDCIRSLAFTHIASRNELLLASGSQDTYIRLWKITCDTMQKKNDTLSLKEQSFINYKEKFIVVLESVLIGHEGWVYGVSWSSHIDSPILLSASMDRTMIVWEYDDENQVWIDKARMGEVGGNTLGYYGCAFGPDKKTIIAHGYQGAFQIWKKEENGESSSWNPGVTISGHFGEVEDFDWDPEGEFVITASSDQTTRLFAPWRRENYETTWHEIARPQIHGYDMKGIAMLDRYRYASGAQEKVVRVFAAPRSFYNTFSSITDVHTDEKMANLLPVGATVPVLGLSNKAVYQEDIQSWNQPTKEMKMKSSPFVNEDPAPFNPTLITEPPVEDILLQNTLWPEVQKLYGHGFEIFSLAATPNGNVLATVCKASKAEHADILIWDTSSWKLVDRLNAHSLTVTQLSFSNNGKYLLSVSRDRTWALHKRNEENHLKYILIQKTDKKNCIHTRIIWSAAWFCDDEYFVTASRDKRLVVWGSVDSHWSACKDPLTMGDSVTAVNVANKRTSTDRYVIAIGLESGMIAIYTWMSKKDASEWNLVINVAKNVCPVLSVKRLRWRYNKKKNGIEDYWHLGVCSSDHSFRILNFNPAIFFDVKK